MLDFKRCLAYREQMRQTCTQLEQRLAALHDELARVTQECAAMKARVDRLEQEQPDVERSGQAALESPGGLTVTS
jgi:hypothetical protein